MAFKQWLADQWCQLQKHGFITEERTDETTDPTAAVPRFAKPDSAVGVVLNRPEKTG